MAETIKREELKFTEDECRNIIYGDDDRFVEIEDTILDNTRWSILHRIVVQRVSDGKFFDSMYSVGATECQDQRAYEGDEPIFTEVFKKEKTILVYE